jgi:hypothetical protein
MTLEDGLPLFGVSLGFVALPFLAAADVIEGAQLWLLGTRAGPAIAGTASIGGQLLDENAGAAPAANSVPKAIAASTRVTPWAGPTVSRLSTEGETMYRVWGGGAAQSKAWLSPINPASSAAAREGMALPAENAALYVSKVTLPAGIRMQVGTAGRAFGHVGGWPQVQLLEHIPASSFGKGVPLP